MAKGIDLYDRKIVYHLDVNARMPVAQLAKKINLSKETVNYRIRRLQKRKYIDHFYILVNASNLGYKYYKAYMSIENATPAIEKEIGDFIISEPSCINLRMLGGEYALVFTSIHKQVAGLREFMQRLGKKYGQYIADKSIHTVVATHKFNQRVLHEGPGLHKVLYHGDLSEPEVDKVDRSILCALSQNARMKLAEMARSIGVDPRVVRYRIKRLEKERIIVGYHMRLHLPTISHDLSQVDIALRDISAVPAMLQFFDSTNMCVMGYENIGRYDLTVELYAEDAQEFKRIMDEFQKRFIKHYIWFSAHDIYQDYVENYSPFHGAACERKEKKNQA